MKRYSKTRLEIGEQDSSFTNMRAGQIYVGVGAFNGDDIAEYLNWCSGLRIVGIEPIKELCDQMRQRFRDNKEVAIINKACWKEKGNITFHEYMGCYKGLSAIPEVMTKLRPWPRIVKYKVEADTLDNILASLSIDEVDYLRVDTEGSEEAVLFGFTRYHPGTQFYIEFHMFNLANVLLRLLEMGARIDRVLMSRDSVNNSHVIGVVAGEFTQCEFKPRGWAEKQSRGIKCEFCL